MRILKTAPLIISLAFAAAAPYAHAAATTTPTSGFSELRRSIVSGKAYLAHYAATSTSPSIATTLRRGSRGKEVRLLQRFLALYGTLPTSTPITGYFGPKTEAALKSFQAQELLPQVGIAGPKTRVRILAISARALAQTARTASTTPTITDVLLTTEVGDDGSGVTQGTLFASTTSTLYAVVTLAGAQTSTKIAYIRYFNGAYVDSAVMHPSRGGLRYAHFQWSLKPGAVRAPGAYTLAFYIDGVRAKTLSYTVQ